MRTPTAALSPRRQPHQDRRWTPQPAVIERLMAAVYGRRRLHKRIAKPISRADAAASLAGARELLSLWRARAIGRDAPGTPDEIRLTAGTCCWTVDAGRWAVTNDAIGDGVTRRGHRAQCSSVSVAGRPAANSIGPVTSDDAARSPGDV